MWNDRVNLLTMKRDKSENIKSSILFRRELEAEFVKQEALLNQMHEEMAKSQSISSNYGTTTPTNVDKEKEEQLWAQQRLVTALKRKVSMKKRISAEEFIERHFSFQIKQETRRLQQNRLSTFLENSASTSASASIPQQSKTRRNIIRSICFFSLFKRRRIRKKLF